VLEREDQKKARPASRLGLSFYPATDLVNGTNQIVADTADNDQGWYGPKYQHWHILRRILKSYADYYNDVGTHRSLNKDAPVSRPVQRTGVITSNPILGGLHRHYVRI
jgi:plasmid maintenance system antidote protein VapI